MSSSAPKLQRTSNYAMFSYVNDNRPLRLNGAKRKKLRKSMQAYGYLPAYPVFCVRKNGRLVVKEGQHRLAVAKELGLEVYYVVDDTDIDIAMVNDTQANWCVGDYAGSYAARGNTEYIQLLEFSERHHLPLSVCVAILGNNLHERNLMDRFKDGKFEIKCPAMADRVATLYAKIGSLSPKVKSRFFMAALFAVCQVDGMDDERLVSGAARQPEMLVRYGSRDGYLAMLEQAYNFGRRVKFPLKISAENAIRDRNPAKLQQVEAA